VNNLKKKTFPSFLTANQFKKFIKVYQKSVRSEIEFSLMNY
jgi:hypothetical protein